MPGLGRQYDNNVLSVTIYNIKIARGARSTAGCTYVVIVCRLDSRDLAADARLLREVVHAVLALTKARLVLVARHRHRYHGNRRLTVHLEVTCRK